METVNSGTIISTRPEVREAMVRKMQEKLKIGKVLNIGITDDRSQKTEGRG
jgi:hypothetical protein